MRYLLYTASNDDRALLLINIESITNFNYVINFLANISMGANS